MPVRLPSCLTLCVLGQVGCNDYGIIKQPLRESFFQKTRDQVDLLLVIDDSPSMLEEREPVAIATSTLLSSMILLELDLRVRAVTTSRVELFAWTAADSIEQLPELAAPLAVEPEGERFEPGLEVALEAAEGARAEAVLHVAILSDEDDASDTPVSEVLAQLAALAPSGVHIHAITGDLPAGCAANGVAADPAPRYREAALITEGLEQSICSATLAHDIEDASLSFTGLQQRFPLSSLPDPDSLLVWVEDAAIDSAPAHSWVWAPAANALQFHGFGVPPPNARIDVEYNVAAPEPGTGLSRLPDTGTPP